MQSAEKPLRLVLEETHWLQELPAPAREQVFRDAFESRHKTGDLVARRGDVSGEWIGVADGLLKLVAVHRSGKVVMLTGVPEGCWVGEGSVMKRELRRYDIVAMRQSRVINLPGATLRWLLDTSIEFNHMIVARLNNRLGQYISMVEIDRLTDPVARVARGIATLYNPVLNPNMGQLLELSQTELGELIGLSRQTINAALKQLEAEGLISTSYGGILIRKLPALNNYEERE
jgi:CRP/FNR family cyclic AMP-dependent transcriptional regulator